jgi:DnaK suppressor protein
VSGELDLEAIEKRLRSRLSEVDAQIADLTKPPERGGAIAFGKRVGEGTTQAIGRFTDVGIANDLQGIKERIERALEKLDESTYGTCDNCGKLIIEGRLHAAPESALCIECARSPRGSLLP